MPYARRLVSAVENQEVNPVRYRFAPRKISHHHSDQRELDYNVVPPAAAPAPAGGALAALAGDSEVETNFSFVVSNRAVQVSFEVMPLEGGNVDFYLRKGAPPVTPDNYHYASVNPGMELDFVVLTTNSAPIPLLPGVWSFTL